VSGAGNRFEALAQPGIQRLKAYDPGHDLVAFRRRFPAGGLVELGSNENAHGPSPAARAAILNELANLYRYPDPMGGDLKRALADRHGFATNQILLGNGSHELLMQFGQVFSGPGTEVVASRYGFAVYALAAQCAGATLRLAEALPRDHVMPRGHDPEALLAAVTPATRLLFFANPNNPTGTWFPTEALERLLQRVPEHVLVVVDEAYFEFVDAPELRSALELLPRFSNLIVCRTFSKAYGLAGLRVGYAVAHPELIALMERVRESFNVNSLGLAGAQAALGDDAHLAWVRDRNAEERAFLRAELERRGHFVHPSQTNFLLVEFGARTAEIEAELTARGVVLRPMGGYGLGECLRITVGTRSENQRLLRVLDEIAA
jgi:histidinol-phosphate aminotransferase